MQTPDNPIGQVAEQILSPGPVGAMTVVLSGLWFLHKGWLRLGREVARLETENTKLEAEVVRERARADKWLEFAVTQLQQTDKALDVAGRATAVIAETGAPNDATTP